MLKTQMKKSKISTVSNKKKESFNTNNNLLFYILIGIELKVFVFLERCIIHESHHK